MTLTPYGHLPMASTPDNSRRETRTDRRQYKLRPSLGKQIDEVVDREGIVETHLIEAAIEKEVRKVPVLGDIHCGPLAEIDPHDIETWVNVGDIFRVKDGDFLLRARGSSMTGDGIQDGDLVLIRPQATCDNNDVAAVMVDFPTGPRATLKRVQFSASSPIVKLLPMNPEHEVIEVDTSKQELRICGVKVGSIRVH